jgi:hypothetical protein
MVRLAKPRKNPLKAQMQTNYGSCLAALNIAISSVRAYAVQHGHLPERNSDLVEITDSAGDNIRAAEIPRVEYGGHGRLTLKSPDRTIILRCMQPQSLDHGGSGFYCALLSGEVLLLPETEAIPGNVCLSGHGKVMIRGHD